MASTTFGTGTRRRVKRQAALAAGVATVLVAALIGMWQFGGLGGVRYHDRSTAVTASAEAVAPAAGLAGGADAPAGAAVAAPRTTIYIVSNAEEAGFLQRFSYEINALRASLGQPAQSTVVIVSDRTESQGTEGELATTQYLLDTVGHLPGSRVFDLRTP